MIDRDHIQTVASELETYANIEGSEIGEMCRMLVGLSHYTDFLSDDFLVVLSTELEEQLDNFKEYSTIVETEEVFTRKVISLEWI